MTFWMMLRAGMSVDAPFGRSGIQHPNVIRFVLISISIRRLPGYSVLISTVNRVNRDQEPGRRMERDARATVLSHSFLFLSVFISDSYSTIRLGIACLMNTSREEGIKNCLLVPRSARHFVVCARALDRRFQDHASEPLTSH